MFISELLSLPIALAAASVAATSTQPITGPARVITGDSLEVSGRKFQMIGIDAPEVLQGCDDMNGKFYRCGADSWKYLNELVQGQSVTCIPVDGRQEVMQLAKCSVDGRDIAAEVLAAGHAVAVGAQAEYAAAEAAARKFSRGLWSGKFVRPAEWRGLTRKFPPVVTVRKETKE